MKVVISIMPVFLSSLQVHAFDIILKGNDSVSIVSGSTARNVKLDIIINGYNVKCDGSKVILWGKPKKLIEESPQDTSVILLDMTLNYKKFEQGISGGVFEVGYLKNSEYAYIGSNQGAFIDLSDGHMKEVSTEFEPSDSSNYESCKKKGSWVFNRYP